jgi:hypothetical protein
MYVICIQYFLVRIHCILYLALHWVLYLALYHVLYLALQTSVTGSAQCSVPYSLPGDAQCFCTWPGTRCSVSGLAPCSVPGLQYSLPGSAQCSVPGPAPYSVPGLASCSVPGTALGFCTWPCIIFHTGTAVFSDNLCHVLYLAVYNILYVNGPYSVLYLELCLALCSTKPPAL